MSTKSAPRSHLVVFVPAGWTDRSLAMMPNSQDPAPLALSSIRQAVTLEGKIRDTALRPRRISRVRTYTSPQLAAVQTRHILAHSMQELDPRSEPLEDLREVNAGYLSGHDLKVVRDTFAETQKTFDPLHETFDYRVVGGENHAALRERLQRALLTILREDAPETARVIVMHPFYLFHFLHYSPITSGGRRENWTTRTTFNAPYLHGYYVTYLELDDGKLVLTPA